VLKIIKTKLKKGVDKQPPPCYNKYNNKGKQQEKERGKLK